MAPCSKFSSTVLIDSLNLWQAKSLKFGQNALCHLSHWLASKNHLLVVAVAVGGGVGTFVAGAGVVVEVLLPSSKGTWNSIKTLTR